MFTVNPINRNTTIEFDYVNYKGERSHRRVRPFTVTLESNEWHPRVQWILFGIDLDKREGRKFAMRDMSNVQEVAG